ncbi:MAG TPA: hypothetical protein VEQ59_23450, partial [Polyangiaceae bacterium]|nr:hypothetical protein [Polyangiaceae bacterium]
GASVAIPWYLLLFTLGMLAASIGFSPEPLQARLRSLPWAWLSGALWLSCVVLSNAFATVWFRFKPLVDPFVGLATAALLVQLTQQVVSGKRGALLGLLASRPLVALGHFSYSLYLSHLPVLALCYLALRAAGVSGPPFLLGMTLGAGLASLVVAHGFHLLVERPFMRRD